MTDRDDVAIERRLSESIAKFALNLYQRHLSPPDRNVLMSPFTISSALAMTFLGAEGQTKEQMKRALQLGCLGDCDLHRAFKDIKETLCDPRRCWYMLHTASKLYAEQSYSFLHTFINAQLDFYDTEPEPANFRSNVPCTAGTINRWVAATTNNKIKLIVEPACIDASTRLLLVSAVYFKGDWAWKFRAADTRDADFHVSSRVTQKVRMMYSKSLFNYGVNDDLDCQALELPYAGGHVSMFVLLPDHTTTSVADLGINLTFDDLVKVTDRFEMSSEQVHVWLPKFQLDEKFSLSKVLSAMGMPNLFTQGVADLSGADGTNELFVKDVVHRSVLDVTEQGREAAAGTCSRVTTGISAPPEFRADHPFTFFIVDKPTKSILFLGHLAQPPSC